MRIVYLDLDTLRPDHLGCYGYHRDTSPNLDQIAAQGVRFDAAYCASSPCVPSRASLFSGRFGIHNGVLSHWGAGSHFRFPGIGHFYDPNQPMLPRHLREAAGLRTVSFSSFADRHQAFWFSCGWSELHTPNLKQGDEVAEEVVTEVLDWLRSRGRQDDYFLHVHLWDAHRPYRVSPDEAAVFGGETAPAWPDEAAIAEHQAAYGPFSAPELYPWPRRPSTMPEKIASVRDWHQLVDGYDGAIHSMDAQVGRIIDALADLGILDETAIIVSADHGEAMGEHGIYADHVCADESVHHIPLVMKWPGVSRAGEANGGMLYNTDLAPTICELLGVRVPGGWDGQPFTAALRRPDQWPGRPNLVWDHGLYCCQRAVRTRNWLYIRTYHPGLFGFAPTMLYHMPSDRHMQVNRSETDLAVVAEHELIMQDWLQDMLGPGRQPDPLQEILEDGPFRYVALDEWIERLRNEGRDDAAAEILHRIGTRDER